MRFLSSFQHDEGVLGMGRLVVSLFRRYITFCEELAEVQVK